MEMLRKLITTCDDLQASAEIPIPFREKIRALRAGLSQVGETVTGLEAENRKLRLRQDSLEVQVMTLAETPEPEPEWWDNIISLDDEDFDDVDSDEWEPDPAA